jgi:hypothetical protein
MEKIYTNHITDQVSQCGYINLGVLPKFESQFIPNTLIKAKLGQVFEMACLAKSKIDTFFEAEA